MHDFMFKVNSDTLTLRVSLSKGGKRVVSWMNPLDSHKAITRGNPVGKHGVPWVDQVKLQRQVAVGPVVSKPQAQAQAQAQALVQAHVANKTHLEADTCVTNGLKVLVGCGQGTSGSGNSLTELGVAAVAPTVGLEAPMREIPLPSPIPVVRAPISAASQSDREPGAAAEALAEGPKAPMRARIHPSTATEGRAPIRWLPSQFVRVRGRLGLSRCIRWILLVLGSFLL